MGMNFQEAYDHRSLNTLKSVTGPSGVNRISILGGGPSGLVQLERFVALAPLSASQDVEITIWEPNHLGAGLHDPHQPDFLPLNTIADQINVFTGQSPNLEKGVKGPSFFQWLQSRPKTAHFEAWEYVSRSLMGEYLADAFDLICRNAPPNMTIIVRRDAIRKVIPAVNGRKVRLIGDTGDSVWTDNLCLCAGHVGRRPVNADAADPKIIERPYPVSSSLANIQPDETVGIQGMGLVASDIVTALTFGRGGTYENRNGETTYVPSGREPKIYLYSRSGMPYRARPFAPLERQRHKPLILTHQKIDMLRLSAHQQDGRLDFAADLLPLLKLEMRAAFHCAAFSIHDTRDGDALRGRLAAFTCLDEPGEQYLKAELDRLDQGCRSFDPDKEMDLSLSPEAGGKDYGKWFQTYLADDLGDARHGLLRSPRKAALEVCRDIRDVIRYAVDFDGLTDSSHAVFYRRYAPLFNRLVGGPVMERNHELIALLRSGVVQLARGPVSSVQHDGAHLRLVHTSPSHDQQNPIMVDRIVKAHDQSSGIIRSACGPVSDLHAAGMLTSVRSVMGLDGVRVDALSRPIDAKGRSVDNLAVLGPLTEGARFYNHYVVGADGPCRALDDADLIARRMLNLPVHHDNCEVPFVRGLNS